MNQRTFALTTIMTSLVASLAVATSSWGAEPEPRTITVSGQGEVRAEPDKAMLQLGVESRKPTLEAARADVAKAVEAALKLTRDLKIEQKHVRTTRLNVQPEYNWDNEARERNLIGYYVSRTIEVDLLDLEKLGQLLERAVDIGINQVSDPQLDSSKRRDLEREALAQAVQDARLNAEAVAKAADARLGPPRTISANSGFVPPPVPFRAKAMAMEAADSAQTYQTGQLGFTATVQVQYDLIPNAGG